MLHEDASSTGIFFLSAHEKSLVKDALSLLDTEASGEAAIVKQRFDCLSAFGKTIALFPSIRESQVLRGCVRDEQQLIKALIALAPSSHLLRIPARIQAVRGFLVTKFHSFSLLCKVLPTASALYEASRSVLFSTMFTIMAEDVCFSCLGDPSCSVEIKTRLADELIFLWDSGEEPAMIKHFRALEALWIARNDSPPSFGTMEGTSELIRLSLDMEEDWHDFLRNQTNNSKETRWALDEFLFGLSYEELLSVRTKLKQSGISAVDFNQIGFYLGSAPVYPIMDSSDPRLIHDFYMNRKEAALSRKFFNTPGPCKTLEEIYLSYRMSPHSVQTG
jgi:hypothetical protein